MIDCYSEFWASAPICVYESTVICVVSQVYRHSEGKIDDLDKRPLLTNIKQALCDALTALKANVYQQGVFLSQHCAVDHAYFVTKYV